MCLFELNWNKAETKSKSKQINIFKKKGNLKYTHLFKNKEANNIYFRMHYLDISKIFFYIHSKSNIIMYVNLY